MVTSLAPPCWRGNVDLDLDVDCFRELANDICPNGFLEDLQFIPVDHRDTSPPFPSNITPTAISILDQSLIPLWMYSDTTWSLTTTNPATNTFFTTLFTTSPLLADSSSTHALLLTTRETTHLITSHCVSETTTLLARVLHPTLLNTILHTKRESPEPDPFTPETFAGEFLSVASPRRREKSCVQFDAKLESPGRIDAKSRRERRVQNLLPDIAKRRRAELEEKRQGYVVRTREDSVVGRENSIVPNISRESSVVPRVSREGSVVSRINRQGSVVPRPNILESQTREAVKQTVFAALRLHSVSPTEPDYKLLITHTVTAAMFSLRTKMRQGKNVGMGEIGGVVEGLLDIFIQK